MRIAVNLDITEEEIRQLVLKHVADQVWMEIQYADKKQLTQKIIDSINWSKMAPVIQEEILKRAAKDLFK